MGYRSTLPQGTPMLTQKHNDTRVQWALKHQDDDWTRTVSTDETCYQLFRNTILAGRKIPKVNSNEFRKTGRKLWYEEVLISKVSLAITHFSKS